MNAGHILVVKFNNGYFEFINSCFTNFLISGVHVQLTGLDNAVLFITVAAPGIDRIEKAVGDFGGVLLG